MSENLLIALIGFSGTIIAALIAAFVVYYIHKKQNLVQKEKSETVPVSNSQQSATSNVPKKASLIDFVEGVDSNHKLLVQTAVKEDGRAAIFYNRKFRDNLELERIEYDIDTSKLYFLTKDGQMRDAGLPLKGDVAKYLRSSDKILLVLMDDSSGETLDGFYLPLRKFGNVE